MRESIGILAVLLIAFLFFLLMWPYSGKMPK